MSAEGEAHRYESLLDRRLLALAALLLLTRFVNLTMAGLHYDETSYIYLAQTIASDWGQRFSMASWVGKQPLHIWLIALSDGLFSDPVFAGRLVSAAAGLSTLLCLWLMATRLFNARVAALAASLYIICPFTLIFDRLALADSLLATAYLWMLYCTLRLKRVRDWLPLIGLVVSFGAALLVKSVAGYFPLLLPAAIYAASDQRDWWRLWPRLIPLVIALVLGYAIYYLAFGSDPSAALVAQHEEKYGRYTMPFSDVFALPLAVWARNLAAVAGWFVNLVTWPLAVAVMGALALLPRLDRGAHFVAVAAVLPILGFIAIAARFYDRYILMSVPLLLLLTARAIDSVFHPASLGWMANRLLLGRPVARLALPALLIILAGQPLIQDFGMLTDLRMANRASAGFYGLRAARDFLAARAAANPVYLVVNLAPGPIEDGSAVVMHDVPGLTVLRLAPLNGKLAIFDLSTKKTYPKDFFQSREVYYASGPDGEKGSWLAGKVTLAQKFSNLDLDSYVGLYRIRFDESFL